MKFPCLCICVKSSKEMILISFLLERLAYTLLFVLKNKWECKNNFMVSSFLTYVDFRIQTVKKNYDFIVCTHSDLQILQDGH